MEQVPLEIQKIILHYCNDKTRRIARATSTIWYNIIDYRGFTVYLTKKSEWPQIADRLCSYSKPINLHFRKNIMNKLEDINEHLLRLTTLTDLTFDDLDKNEVGLEAEWFKLTALPNLHSISVKNYEYHIPLEALLSMPNLTTFEQPWRSEDTDNMQLLRSMQRWTNLQSCSISQKNELNVDLFGSHSSKLTYLYLFLPDVSSERAEKLFQNLGNLKHLQVVLENDKKPEEISLSSLTALEDLAIKGIPIHELNSTNLTYLELFSVVDKDIEKELHKLVRLKQLVLDFAETNPTEYQQLYSHQWLTALTRLEELNIDPINQDGLYFLTTTLTRLQIHINEPADLDYLSKFTSLKRLYIIISAQNSYQNLSVVSTLTQLDALRISIRNSGIADLGFPVSVLSDLTWLSLSNCAMEISHLTKLEDLTLTGQSEECQFTGFVGLSNLTRLNIQVARNHSQVTSDYAFISTLTTLKCLMFTGRMQQVDCSYFTTLTGLEALHFKASDADFSHLSSLTKLTMLETWMNGSISAKIVQLPTSLQELEVTRNYSQTEEISESLIEQLRARMPNLCRHSFE